MVVTSVILIIAVSYITNIVNTKTLVEQVSSDTWVHFDVYAFHLDFITVIMKSVCGFQFRVHMTLPMMVDYNPVYPFEG